ncbi:receptor-like protein EIX2 isoform X2 [Cajanus cajan]|uniref:receptor-like protein EIX2 isoform X2 n=2 Tax=Cajanus cajan TaxID=3821 RepID=UPI00098DADA3|nr:receptor-like protein EIX2 isoform X2 [Cajanus cajan]
MSHLTFLDISNNHIYGSIPLSINRIQNLSYLALSNNYLTGTIPMFWMVMGRLRSIDLSNNSFSGNNRLIGYMPKEITKNLPLLEYLLLRGNTLAGSIPEEVCGLHSLNLLDLAENNLSGSIPTCLGDVHGFKLPQTYFIYETESRLSSYTTHVELMVKGKITEYENGMFVHSTIDLSNNDPCGRIPEKLTELIHLGILNLSWNRLTGNIPSTIGSLKDLESLDLSHNHLSGPIPASMASMTFLSNLNLSYNNLSGQIPFGNQFDTFNDPSIYEGNPKLCGKPLPTNCSSALPGNEEKGGKHEDGADEKIERLWLYGSIAFGYITGFWLVCGSLMLKRSWRHAYFNFAFDMRDKLLVLIAVNLARVKRKFGLERN